MAEYEPDDSRTVTNTQNRAPGEPPRTGPREDEARARAKRPDGAKAEGDSPSANRDTGDDYIPDGK